MRSSQISTKHLRIRSVPKPSENQKRAQQVSCLLAGHEYDPVWHSLDGETLTTIPDKADAARIVTKKSYFICKRCQLRVTYMEYFKE